MPDIQVGDVYNCQGYFAEVTRYEPDDFQVADAAGEWVDAVEFTNAPAGSASARYTLPVDTFLESYFRVAEEESAEHPPEVSQMPADTKPPKPTLF